MREQKFEFKNRETTILDLVENVIIFFGRGILKCIKFNYDSKKKYIQNADETEIFNLKNI